MEIVISESGKSFDPVIVDILRRRYIELERVAVSSGSELPNLGPVPVRALLRKSFI